MKKLVAVVGVAGLAFGGWRLARRHDAPHDSSLVMDRLWIDRLPKTDRDTVNLFAVLSNDVGIFDTRSMWQGQFEMFTVDGDDGRGAQLTFPQTDKTENVRFTATACKQKDWDYCLEISGSKHGVKRYVSRKGWELDGAGAERALADRLVHAQ